MGFGQIHRVAPQLPLERVLSAHLPESALNLAESHSHQMQGYPFTFPRCAGLRQYGLPTFPLGLSAQGSVQAVLAKGMIWGISEGELMDNEAGGATTRNVGGGRFFFTGFF